MFRTPANNRDIGREMTGYVISILAEPCKGIVDILIAKYHLEDVTAKDILLSLLHRGGLYARVLHGGSVRAGDSIKILPE